MCVYVNKIVYFISVAEYGHTIFYLFIHRSIDICVVPICDSTTNKTTIACKSPFRFMLSFLLYMPRSRMAVSLVSEYLIKKEKLQIAFQNS